MIENRVTYEFYPNSPVVSVLQRRPTFGTGAESSSYTFSSYCSSSFPIPRPPPLHRPNIDFLQCHLTKPNLGREWLTGWICPAQDRYKAAGAEAATQLGLEVGLDSELGMVEGCWREAGRFKWRAKGGKKREGHEDWVLGPPADFLEVREVTYTGFAGEFWDIILTILYAE